MKEYAVECNICPLCNNVNLFWLDLAMFILINFNEDLISFFSGCLEAITFMVIYLITSFVLKAWLVYIIL